MARAGIRCRPTPPLAPQLGRETAPLSVLGGGGVWAAGPCQPLPPAHRAGCILSRKMGSARPNGTLLALGPATLPITAPTGFPPDHSADVTPLQCRPVPPDGTTAAGPGQPSLAPRLYVCPDSPHTVLPAKVLPRAQLRFPVRLGASGQEAAGQLPGLNALSSSQSPPDPRGHAQVLFWEELEVPWGLPSAPAHRWGGWRLEELPTDLWGQTVSHTHGEAPPWSSAL